VHQIVVEERRLLPAEKNKTDDRHESRAS
jgi:hypothetical protein